MFENILFSNVDFLVRFEGFFSILGSFWTAQNRPKFKTLPLGPSKNSPKSVQDDPKIDFGACLGHIFFQRSVWEGFWEEFWWIFRVADHFVDSYSPHPKCGVFVFT